MKFKTLLILLAISPVFSQEIIPPHVTPLPSIEFLTHKIIEKQQELRPTTENYVHTEISVMKIRDSSGKLKKEETKEYEVIRVNGHSIKRLLLKNGLPLSAKETAKEEQKIQKESDKALNEESTDSIKKIGIQQLLKMSKITNATRVMYNNINAIALDFIPKENVKPNNKSEEMVSKLAGRFFVDEFSYEFLAMKSHLIAPVKLWGGVLASIKEGSTIELETAVVNNELRLPSKQILKFPTRALFVVTMGIEIETEFKNYKKFSIENTKIEKVL